MAREAESGRARAERRVETDVSTSEGILLEGEGVTDEAVMDEGKPMVDEKVTVVVFASTPAHQNNLP